MLLVAFEAFDEMAPADGWQDMVEINSSDPKLDAISTRSNGFIYCTLTHLRHKFKLIQYKYHCITIKCNHKTFINSKCMIQISFCVCVCLGTVRVLKTLHVVLKSLHIHSQNINIYNNLGPLWAWCHQGSCMLSPPNNSGLVRQDVDRGERVVWEKYITIEKTVLNDIAIAYMTYLCWHVVQICMHNKENSYKAFKAIQCHFMLCRHTHFIASLW